jgi:hypothetical protein
MPTEAKAPRDNAESRAPVAHYSETAEGEDRGGEIKTPHRSNAAHVFDRQGR